MLGTFEGLRPRTPTKKPNQHHSHVFRRPISDDKPVLWTEVGPPRELPRCLRREEFFHIKKPLFYATFT